MKKPKPTFESSTDVERCIVYLADRERASYDAMSRHLNRQINGRDRYVLVSARRQLERDRGIIFVTERGIGIVRANNGQVATLATAHPIGRVKRITRQANKRQAHVNVQALTADEMLAFSIGRVVINAINKSTRRSFYRQISDEIKKRDNELPLTLDQVLTLPRHRKKI